MAYRRIADEEFIRGNIPMTKEEVRTISISKLELSADAVVYDVGAGTGSVAVTMALHVRGGQVYAIEKNPEAVRLIGANQEKFRADNLVLVSGKAPEALEKLPAPSHVFIGGSGGNLQEIVTVILKKNPTVRMVLNAVTMETLQEMWDLEKTLPVEVVDFVQISVAKAKEVGRYHLLFGQNPVWIMTITGRA